MKAVEFFTQANGAQRLYLTYHQNPMNYQKIKEQIAGEDAKTRWESNQRSRWFFLGGVTAIALPSSMFSISAGNWSSVVAIWTIWAGVMVILGAVSWWSYRLSYRVLLDNEAFFSQFERVANAAASVDEFRQTWGNVATSK